MADMHGSPLFPPVPIIGQTFQVVGWLLQAVLRCKCRPAGEEEILLVVGRPGGAHATCPNCHKVYALHGINVDAQGNIGLMWATGLAKTTEPS